YAAMNNSDARVRTGAYKIVGVQKTIKVKAGQTLSSISRLYFGPGMECYIEVMNGKTELKEGEIVKIPELKNKHSK
ncbi:MAG: HU family DNA-binding protein, partial [Prevotella sp.]|nr:HU family DNA-binding protein [Prevotella sp.]